jgi:hypothetical protein
MGYISTFDRVNRQKGHHGGETSDVHECGIFSTRRQNGWPAQTIQIPTKTNNKLFPNFLQHGSCRLGYNVTRQKSRNSSSDCERNTCLR